MSYKEFLQKLSKTPRTWRLDAGRIVCSSPNNKQLLCPLHVVAGCQQRSTADAIAIIANKYPSSLTSEDVETWRRVWEAADNFEGHCPSIRSDLLKACGLNGNETTMGNLSSPQNGPPERPSSLSPGMG